MAREGTGINGERRGKGRGTRRAGEAKRRKARKGEEEGGSKERKRRKGEERGRDGKGKGKRKGEATARAHLASFRPSSRLGSPYISAAAHVSSLFLSRDDVILP